MKNFNVFRLNGTPRTKPILSRFMDRRGQEVIDIEDYFKKCFLDTIDQFNSNHSNIQSKLNPEEISSRMGMEGTKRTSPVS